MANRPRAGNRNRNRNRARNQQRSINSIKRRSLNRNRNRINLKSKVMDARHKIMLKKRTSVKDARDILAKMAKGQDARNKILKMREARKGENVINSNIRAISANILKKTDRNGKISLITSKNKQSTNDINLAIQQQLGLIHTQKKSAPRSPPPPLMAIKTASRKPQPTLISKTIVNDPDYPPPHQLQHSYENYPEIIMGPRILPPLTTRRHQQQMRLHSYSLDPYARNPIASSSYIDLDAPDDEEMPLVVSPLKQTIVMQGTSRSSNVHSRLDSAPAQAHSHGIFAAHTKTKVVVPAGHRIVVSNLQQTVTQDDIRELFEDIGQLLVARLVRPGTAEVIYKNLKDAQKAVDTYHNRQLDGQPMKCLLVNKRPINNPTGPPLSTSKQDSAGILAAMNKKAPAKTVEKLVPDLQTIHKVLFQRN